MIIVCNDDLILYNGLNVMFSNFFVVGYFRVSDWLGISFVDW